MRTIFLAPSAGALALLLAYSHTASATDVSVCTDIGALTIELFDEQAPRHAANFLEYVDQGYYTNTVFHRVIDGFMIQGGGYDRALREKASREPIQNESRNGVGNLRGTLAAARTGDPHSATAQYFINLVDNDRLDGSSNTWGYTVFGRVTGGMEIVDEIAALPTRGAGQFPTDVPDPLVAVTSMARLDSEVLAAIPDETRIDTIRQRIDTAIANEDHAAALNWIGHYRAVCGNMDSDLLLLEANTASALLQVSRAQAALEHYFAETDEGHEGFQDALTLFSTVAPGVDVPTSSVIGHCEAPPPPIIPDGTSAALDELVAGQTAIREFMAASELHLDCLSEVIDEQEVTDEQHAIAVSEHNRVVTQMEQLAEDFNTQVRAFRARD